MAASTGDKAAAILTTAAEIISLIMVMKEILAGRVTIVAGQILVLKATGMTKVLPSGVPNMAVDATRGITRDAAAPPLTEKVMTTTKITEETRTIMAVNHLTTGNMEKIGTGSFMAVREIPREAVSQEPGKMTAVTDMVLILDERTGAAANGLHKGPVPTKVILPTTTTVQETDPITETASPSDMVIWVPEVGTPVMDKTTGMNPTEIP